MRKLLLTGLMLVLLIVFAQASFAVPGTITLDSRINGGGEYTNGVKFLFEAGTYEFSVVNGGWNAWFLHSGGVAGCNSEGANCTTGWMWTMDIYQPSTSTYFRLGSKADKYNTQDKAYNAHANDYLVLTQPSDGDLWFYVKDGQPGDGNRYAYDNAGSVTFDVALVPGPNPSPVAPEPVSSVLFLIGGAAFGFRRFLSTRKTG